MCDCRADLPAERFDVFSYIECSCLPRFSPLRKRRNGRRASLRMLVGAIQWGFESTLPHQQSVQRLRRGFGNPAEDSTPCDCPLCKFLRTIACSTQRPPLHAHAVPTRRRKAGVSDSLNRGIVKSATYTI